MVTYSKNRFWMIGALGLFFYLLLFLPSFVEAYNYEHVNVTSTVNITDAMPEILAVEAEQDITLNAGGNTTITCNATIRDWNGFNDLSSVNGTFYYYLNESSDPDHRNVHYTNASCEEVSNDGEFIANYTCSFTLAYFANNGSWSCNVTAEDTFGFTDSANNTTSINALFALNVTDVIDFGDLAVTETSSNITANITNFGNMDINVSVLGYGEVEGDGVGLVCEHGGNISVENERFSGIEVPWDNKIPLAATAQDMNITIPQATEESNPEIWSSYWQLYVPPNPFGECNGTIRFTATAP
jgi:hypothetical protein